ncbi:MAG: nucleotidyltransferase domain-containing protein [Dehalococcoidia bacterium]|nr:nucleotidyltransferase domain-containing protein [Dehalococcoidia bacterium]
MAGVATELNNIIRRYRQELVKSGIRPGNIFLYGSYARGEAHEGSDIDLIIVSPDFKGLNLLKRLETLGMAAGRVLEPIQAYGFTPQEIEELEPDSFWGGILKEQATPV